MRSFPGLKCDPPSISPVIQLIQTLTRLLKGPQLIVLEAVRESVVSLIESLVTLHVEHPQAQHVTSQRNTHSEAALQHQHLPSFQRILLDITI